MERNNKTSREHESKLKLCHPSATNWGKTIGKDELIRQPPRPCIKTGQKAKKVVEDQPESPISDLLPHKKRYSRPSKDRTPNLELPDPSPAVISEELPSPKPRELSPPINTKGRSRPAISSPENHKSLRRSNRKRRPPPGLSDFVLHKISTTPYSSVAQKSPTSADMGRENAIYIIGESTKKAMDNLRTHILKTGKCHTCKKDIPAKFKEARNHSWDHFIITVCNCGIYHTDERIIRLHQTKDHPAQQTHYRVDYNGWTEVRDKVPNLPRCRPALPW